MARSTFGFPRRQRLTREADLESVRRTGKRMQTEHLEARASASLLRYARIGVVVPKYKRNIVERNRVRRRLRELARTRLLPLLGNVDLLIRAKPSAYGSGFPELAGEVDQIAGMVNSVIV